MRSLLLLTLLTPLTPVAQSGPPLAALKDNHRVLLLFAASEQDKSYQQQVEILKTHTPEMQARDLLPLPMLAKAAQDSQQADLRHRFHVDPDKFTVILIGKDGSEKLRRHAPLTAEQLEKTIDAMPMRKDEMRQKP